MIIHKNYGTVTTSGGTASATLRVSHAILMQVFIAPASATTSYDFVLTDVHDLNTFGRANEVGTFNELTQLPSPGNYTLTISNASADQAFTYLILYRDK